MNRRIALASWAASVGLFAGCGQPQGSADAAPTTPEQAAAKPVPTPILSTMAPESPASTKVPQPTAPPPVPFAYPPDAGGKKLAAVLTPSATLAPVALAGAGPKPRTSDIDRGDLPLPKVVAKVPSLPNPTAKPVRPSAPLELIPADLGQAAAENPGAVKLAEKPLVRATEPLNPGAGDVPPLARPTADRAPLEDPTTEIASLRAVNTPFPAPFLTVWFVRFTIPDPFEFAEQLKGKVGTEIELGTAPVSVPPAGK